MSLPAVTFAIVGHNEAATVGYVIGLAREACQASQDAVWFVDSASTDVSAAVARKAGARVIHAPLGKGSAMQTALDRCETESICFLDADICGASRNIAAVLRRAVTEVGADLIVGDFCDEQRGILSNTLGVYAPLVDSLFPEARGRFGSKPLTGFRVLRVARAPHDLPSGFGIEAHLNVALALDRASISVAQIGRYRGRFRYKPMMGWEIAAPLLDLAEQYGRIDSRLRTRWESWVEQVVRVIAGYRNEPGRRDAFYHALTRAAARPRPEAMSSQLNAHTDSRGR